MKCMACEYVNMGGEHCVGKQPGCTCSCTVHTLDEEDVRLKFMGLLTAEAHDEPALLRELIAGLRPNEQAMCLIIAVKYATWMVREAGIDPVKQVQDAALFWRGGEPSGDADEDDATGTVEDEG